MISELTLHRYVTVRAESLKRQRLVSACRSSIMTRLLEDLARERVCKAHGYYLGVTGLSKIGKGKATEGSGDVSFPVVFKCRTFRPLKGEILHGVVYRVCSSGVFVRCGPIRCAYISSLKMPGYTHDREPPGGKGNQRFVSEDRAAIENGVVLSFAVLDARWSDGVRSRNGFQMLGNLEGESLGPVSFPASGELDL